MGGKRRKLPRTARWTEYLGTPPAPATELALDRGTRLVARLGLGSLIFTPAYAPIPVIYAIPGLGTIDVNLAITAPISVLPAGNGVVTWADDLMDDEFVALMAMI